MVEITFEVKIKNKENLLKNKLNSFPWTNSENSISIEIYVVSGPEHFDFILFTKTTKLITNFKKISFMPLTRC